MQLDVQHVDAPVSHLTAVDPKLTCARAELETIYLQRSRSLRCQVLRPRETFNAVHIHMPLKHGVMMATIGHVQHEPRHCLQIVRC